MPDGTFGWRWWVYCMAFGLVVCIAGELIGVGSGPVAGLISGACAALSWHFANNGA